MSAQHPLHALMHAIRHDGHELCYNDLVELEKTIMSTPASHWQVEGQADPHGKAYDIERASLPLGWLSDDELANGVFMNYNAPLDVQGILEKRCHSPIAWVTAAKDRIRWLSRRLQNLRAHHRPPRSPRSAKPSMFCKRQPPLCAKATPRQPRRSTTWWCR